MSDVSVRMTLVDGVSSTMQKITNSARTAAMQFSNAGKAMDNAFRSGAAESFASQAGSAFDSVESAAEALGNAIDEAVSGFNDFSTGNMHGVETAFSDTASRVEDLSDSASQASENVDELADSAGELGDAIDDIDGESRLDDVGDSAKQTGEQLDNAANSALNFGNVLKTALAAVSVAKIAGEVKDFVSDSVEQGMNFTSMMSEVAAISGANETELAALEASAREYGATTVFSATEAAEALKYMSLAGWDANQSTSALGGVLNLAAASGMGLGEASDMVTDYLSAFGMQANQSAYFADMLAYAQSNSNTTAAQLGEAYLNSAANLHAAGQDVETTTSLLEAMANQGTKGARAGTQLAAMARDITNAMEDGAIKIGDTSIAVQDAQGNFRDYTDILTEVGEAVDGMGSAERAAALSEIFTADSIKGINQVLTEGMDNISRYEDELRNSTGSAEKAADTMNDNLTGDLANMNSAFEEMQLQVFEGMEGTAREGAQYLTNTVIPTLTEWVPEAVAGTTEVIGKIGKALSPILETVMKNPGAVASAFTAIGTGFAAFKTVNRIGALTDLVSAGGKLSESGGLVGGLAKLGTTLTAHPWAAGAAAVTAAVVAVGAAVKKYNELQIEDSLTEHFGNIELDESQIEDFASKVIDAQWLVNINAALGHFENAEELTQQAEEALASNDTLEWKARVGLTLTDDEVDSYQGNIETFVTNIEQSLSEQTLAAKLVVDEFELKAADGTSLGSKIAEWAESDLQEVSTLSAGLTKLVENALEDGIIDVDEQAAIDQLQSKISNIMAGWQEAEAQAEMDVLTQKYGRLSGKDLTEDTFTKVVEELGEQRETATSALEESEKKLYTTLNALNRTDENGMQRISDAELADYKQQAGYAIRNEEASMIGNSLQFETNTLSDAYGAKLDENYASIQEKTSSFLSNANNYLANEDYMSLFDSMQYAYSQAMTGTNIFSDKDQKALSKIYDAMKPDVESMAGLIDEYREMGQAVPQDVMMAFNDAMMVGAAAGDTSAAWQVFANQMVADPASNALVQAIQDGTVSVPEELRTAIDRATTKVTDEPVTIEGMQAEIDDMEVDQSRVDDLIAKAFDGLEATGETVTINGQAMVEYEVTAGQTMSEIASQAGIALEELIAANPQIENPNIIQIGQKINIPASACEVDASGVGETVEESVREAVASAGTSENTVPAEITAEPEITAEKANMEPMRTSVQNDLDGMDSWDTEGTADVTLDETNNVDEVYSEVASQARTAFNTHISASGVVDVTLSWHITNPTATVAASVSGGTVTATIASAAPHAEGGIFDTPHYGVFAESGPEAFIPIDGSENAKSIWMETGERLGMLSGDAPIQMAPAVSAGGGGRKEKEESGSHRTVDININGNGRITAGGGLSKEDVVEILMERARDVIVGIVEQEALVGGDESYVY